MSAYEIISKTGRAIKVPNRAVWHLDKETLGKVNICNSQTLKSRMAISKT